MHCTSSVPGRTGCDVSIPTTVICCGRRRRSASKRGPSDRSPRGAPQKVPLLGIHKRFYNKRRSSFHAFERGEILSKKLVLSLMMMGVLAYSHSAFGQTVPTGQQRIVQEIII